jgi:hypothetical protein
MSKNRDKNRLSFTKQLDVKMSGRGYVTARVRGTDIDETVDMSSIRKDQINAIYAADGALAGDTAWREEMKKVEARAIEQARQRFSRGEFKRK